jgi:hypothetical protein
MSAPRELPDVDLDDLLAESTPEAEAGAKQKRMNQ